MERNGRVAVVGVLLVVSYLALLLLAVPSRADVIAGRVRRQSPWLQRAPLTFALGKKFARNRPAASTAFALETNTDWRENAVEQSRPAQPVAVRPLAELSAEVTDSKPAPRSRAFYGCMSNCLTLSQYNPVCGTDHTTYHNEYKLECANRCGAKPRVSIKKSGIC
uniref:Kazal-like domain-containing protein n=1 Tax=Anopheles quadriannulatus TaxID=34691 RepID=A0A182X210_ANOQN